MAELRCQFDGQAGQLEESTLANRELAKEVKELQAALRALKDKLMEGRCRNIEDTLRFTQRDHARKSWEAA